MAANSMKLAEHCTTTIIGQLNQLMAWTPGTAGDLKAYTLNSKYGIIPNEVPSSKTELRYFGIGINGYKNTDDATGSTTYIGDVEDQDLYYPIPIRVVSADEDLSPSERLNLRMRVPIIDHTGAPKIAYYLKLIEYEAFPSIVVVDEDGVQIPYQFDPANLSPTPKDPNAGQSSPTVNKLIRVSRTGTLALSGAEVHESIFALFGPDQTKANVSEIAIYSGEDVNSSISGIDDGVSYVTPYTEAAYVHLAMHYTSTGQSFPNQNTQVGFNFRLDSGKGIIS